MSAPVKHTSPDIDKVIIGINDAMKAAGKARKSFGKDHEADDYFWDVEYALDGLKSILEDLRKANAALREWGEGLEKENEKQFITN